MQSIESHHVAIEWKFQTGDFVPCVLSRLLFYVLTECRWLSRLEIGNKRSMIAFGLICVDLGERSNRLIEHVFLAQVAANHGRITRTGMRTCERPPTEFGILVEATFAQSRDV